MFGKPSKKKFAKLLIERIAENYGLALAFNASDFTIVTDEGDVVLNLANMYVDYCNHEKSDRDEYLTNAASIVGGQGQELPDDFGRAKPNLRPKIWSRLMIEAMALQGRAQGDKTWDIPLVPLGEHLYASLAYDTPGAMCTVSNEQLETWGASVYEALEIAKHNLQENTMAWAKIGDALVRSATGDSYDSSRLLLLDAIGSFELPGKPIAIVPTRESLIVAGSDDPDAVRIMFEVAKNDLENEPRPLSPLPLILEDGEWIDWEPPPNHVVRSLYDELALGYYAEAYGTQKELLEKIQEFDPVIPFVATFMAFQKEEANEVTTMAVWSEGVDAILPKADLIAFTNGREQLASGEWANVLSIVGDLIQRDGTYYPARYRVRQFPSDEQLAQIGNVMG